MARDERGVTAQSEDFAAWYNEVVFKAGLWIEVRPRA
ncbi:prolyl-tRNA synthetase, partial [Rhodococcus wratislaviensis IFP 2016]